VLERRPDGGGCDRCDSGYPQRGDWRPLLSEPSHRPPGPSKPATPQPVVLCLPEVPEGAVALIDRDGDRWVPSKSTVPAEQGWFMARLGMYLSLPSLLGSNGPLTVEFAPPREPRTWEARPLVDDAPDDLRAVSTGERGEVYRRDPGNPDRWVNSHGAAERWELLREVDLTEVIDS
jgi:hypothetical protein